MFDEPHNPERDDAESLLRRALLDERAAMTVSLRIDGLPVSDAVTVIFYARRDLGTLQTYLTPGSRGAGSRLALSDLLRVPCDLDLADAEDRDAARELYGHQARMLRDAVLSADILLGVWREPLEALSGHRVVDVDHRVNLDLRLPKPRLLPTALVSPELHLVVTPVTSPRTLAEGSPPLGIACAQQDVAKIYPVQEDPEACVIDFLEYAASRAQSLAERLAHQEASVERFLEISEDDAA
ncbi:MAG TPA: hypothetical protein VFN48_02060 [Solirubrobacteraceae bacterium]|nr:hypothetical protein [Solirubrobacteraceae bacterium]